MKNLSRFLLLLVSLCCLAVLMLAMPAQAGSTRTIYVTEAGGGTGDSWDSPMTLGQALAETPEAGQNIKIFIQAGTYYFGEGTGPNYVTEPHTLKDRVYIYGGFRGIDGDFLGETSENERVRTDADGNGITEPWEFANPTVFISAIRCFSGKDGADSTA